jgi:hypothetical protein
VPRRTIDRIRERILLQEYDMTVHAMEEMAEDDLDILDIEQAIFNGRLTRTERTDFRGTRHTVEGIAVDGQTPVAIVGRFTTTGRYLIITVYEIIHSKG